jgi:signal transduction histidine kinase
VGFSLKSRLGWGLIISLVVLFVAQSVLVGVLIRGLAENRIASRLGHDAESILSAVDPAASGVALDSHINPIYARPFSGHYYLVASGDDVVRSRSLWDQDLLADLSKKDIQGHHVAGPQGQPLLVVVHHFNWRGKRIQMAVAEDLTELITEVRRAQLQYALLSLVALLLVLAVQRRLVMTSLKPLDGVHDDVAALERGEVASLRETVPDEVRPLVQEFNRLLALMEGRVSRSRNALGNLAHALKTPLTLLTQLADRPELAPHESLRERLVDETGKIGSLMERELKRARLAGVATPGHHLVLKGELLGLAGALKAVYRDKGIELEIDVPDGLTVAADREDMLELFGNLLDNACKWATSRVRLQALDGDKIVVTVADDGPGCPEEELGRLAQRGVRADESAPGHGLGLAIAREVAQSYGGTLELGRDDALGGFRATVSLPVRSATDS